MELYECTIYNKMQICFRFKIILISLHHQNNNMKANWFHHHHFHTCSQAS